MTNPVLINAAELARKPAAAFREIPVESIHHMDKVVVACPGESARDMHPIIVQVAGKNGSKFLGFVVKNDGYEQAPRPGQPVEFHQCNVFFVMK